jgi:hypothetical protein
MRAGNLLDRLVRRWHVINFLLIDLLTRLTINAGMRIRSAVFQCGVCEAWTRNGDHFPSGGYDALTGGACMDNYICFGCVEQLGLRRVMTCQQFGDLRKVSSPSRAAA